MQVVEHLNDQQLITLHQLYQQEWWTKGRTLDDTRRAVASSQLVIGLLNRQQSLVGFARVLTDFTFKALVLDVIVANDYRKQGLGDQLIKLIKQHQKLANVKMMELYCLPELVPFYQSHQFSTDVGGIQLMRLTKA